MTLDHVTAAIRAYIKETGWDGGRYQSTWADIVDATLTELRTELLQGPAPVGVDADEDA